MALQSVYFHGVNQAERAATNSPPMRRGSRGDGVRAIQYALIDLGTPLPGSMRGGVADGIFGGETFAAVRAFQQSNPPLGADGVAGRNTMTTMDGILVARGIRPATPIPTTDSNLPVHVRGLIAPVSQTNSMNCWAASLAILRGWRRQLSISEIAAVQELGPTWLQMQQNNTGLAASRHEEFARVANLVSEPLMSIPMSEWIRLLRENGPIWVVYGWRRFAVDGTLERVGRHAVIAYSMTGDGSPAGTIVHYINPSGGRLQQKTFALFVRSYEIGFEIGSGDQVGFTQLVHY